MIFTLLCMFLSWEVCPVWGNTSLVIEFTLVVVRCFTCVFRGAKDKSHGGFLIPHFVIPRTNTPFGYLEGGLIFN